MLVVQWWRSFACPGSQAEGKRYHNWDGCIEWITQLDSWPDVRTGSSTEAPAPRLFRPLPPGADSAAPALALVEAIGHAVVLAAYSITSVARSSIDGGTVSPS